MKNNKITIKQTDSRGFEFDVLMPAKKRDAHVRFEDDQWMVDIFNSAINHSGKAYLKTETLENRTGKPDWNEVFNTMEEA